jgi:hypothetical protein
MTYVTSVEKVDHVECSFKLDIKLVRGMKTTLGYLGS